MKYNSKESSIFFEFLRFCIHDDAVEPVSLDSMDWDALYDFGNRQAILGVLYRGLMKLSKSNFRPDRLQILKWYSGYSRIEKANKQNYYIISMVLKVVF